MLFKETVEPATLALIQLLQRDPLFDKFYLAGGTALSLQLGHRTSVDIDLFSRSSFNHEYFLEHLEKKYTFSLQYMNTNTLKGIVNGVFIDILTHDYVYISETIEIDGIKMLDKTDIAAMKVNAISGNGTRAKDFIDIYFLLKEFQFGQIIEFYSKKYGFRNEFHAIKSLTYFNDMNTDDWPFLRRETELTISKLKKEIVKKRDAFLKSL